MNEIQENVNFSFATWQKKQNEEKIDKMESDLEKGDFFNNDPLLTEIELNQNDKTKNEENEAESSKSENKIINFDLEKCLKDNLFNKICQFLTIDELVQFKNTSKHFDKLFKLYIIHKLEKKKIYLKTQMENIEHENNVKLDIANFSLSKASKKAFILLNNQTINQIFYENSKPNKDKLIIYRLFFQIINHKYQYIYDNVEFWTKCKYFFSKEIECQTGDLLQKIVDEKKIDINYNNLYKIYKIAEKNLDKIYPGYFSSTCGATGLFAFFIKDILDFLGISNEPKIQGKSFCTLEQIIKSIDEKITRLK
jgi:hypothetical protein